MNTQTQDTARTNRIEAARLAALGALSRAKETLQVAATTVPVWARGVEQKAGEQADALLERVGLVRIAKVAAQRPAAAEPAASEPAAEAKVEAVATSAEAVEASDEAVEASTAATDVPAAEATPATAEPAGDRSARRRRR
ncbi:MAG: hypothetical protein JWM10_1207 [Myxococcaceae bacterium]|nr:hypothetical protein [Myxococcaceae bacterium]